MVVGMSMERKRQTFERDDTRSRFGGWWVKEMGEYMGHSDGRTCGV